MINKGRDDLRSRAILTDDQVIQIKKLLNCGIYTQTEIGDMFGVSRGAILGIHLGYNWKHVA